MTFYYSFTNAYLNEVGVSNAAGKMTLGQVSEIGMMLLMPLVFRVATVRWILLVGLLSWAARYVLLAYGDPGPGVWMFYLAIIMHGVCFDFFFVTGQLYTDQQAPPHLRSTAQGFITAMTYGVGMLVGSLLSGGVLDYFSKTAADGTITRDWTAFWLTSASMSFAIMLLVLFFFRTNARIRAKECRFVAASRVSTAPRTRRTAVSARGSRRRSRGKTAAPALMFCDRASSVSLRAGPPALAVLLSDACHASRRSPRPDTAIRRGDAVSGRGDLRLA